MSVINGDKVGQVVPKRRQKEKDDPYDFTACNYCSTFVLKTHLQKHLTVCKQSEQRTKHKNMVHKSQVQMKVSVTSVMVL